MKKLVCPVLVGLVWREASARPGLSSQTRCQPTQAVGLATSRPVSIWKAKNRDKEDTPHKWTWTHSPSLGFHPSHHSLLLARASTALARQTSKPFGKFSWTATWRVLRGEQPTPQGESCCWLLRENMGMQEQEGRRGGERRRDERAGGHTHMCICPFPSFWRLQNRVMSKVQKCRSSGWLLYKPPASSNAWAART